MKTKQCKNYFSLSHGQLRLDEKNKDYYKNIKPTLPFNVVLYGFPNSGVYVKSAIKVAKNLSIEKNIVSNYNEEAKKYDFIKYTRYKYLTVYPRNMFSIRNFLHANFVFTKILSELFPNSKNLSLNFIKNYFNSIKNVNKIVAVIPQVESEKIVVFSPNIDKLAELFHYWYKKLKNDAKFKSLLPYRHIFKKGSQLLINPLLTFSGPKEQDPTFMRTTNRPNPPVSGLFCWNEIIKSNGTILYSKDYRINGKINIQASDLIKRIDTMSSDINYLNIFCCLSNADFNSLLLAYSNLYTKPVFAQQKTGNISNLSSENKMTIAYKEIETINNLPPLIDTNISFNIDKPDNELKSVVLSKEERNRLKQYLNDAKFTRLTKYIYDNSTISGVYTIMENRDTVIIYSILKLNPKVNNFCGKTIQVILNYAYQNNKKINALLYNINYVYETLVGVINTEIVQNFITNLNKQYDCYARNGFIQEPFGYLHTKITKLSLPSYLITQQSVLMDVDDEEIQSNYVQPMEIDSYTKAIPMELSNFKFKRSRSNSKTRRRSKPKKKRSKTKNRRKSKRLQSNRKSQSDSKTKPKK